MLRAAICDDNKPVLDFLSQEIKRSLDANKVEYTADSFVDAEEMMRSHRGQPYDILFLDICMPKRSGFEIAEEIRENAEKTTIVFVTENDHLVYESMNYQPFYFIRKSNSETLKSEIDKTVKKLITGMARYKKLQFNTTNRGTVICPASAIVFCEVTGHYLRFVTDGYGEFRVRGTISQAEELSGSGIFLRIHKSYSVNMSRVTAFHMGARKLTVFGNVELPIGRTYEREVKETYLRYLRGL